MSVDGDDSKLLWHVIAGHTDRIEQLEKQVAELLGLLAGSDSLDEAADEDPEARRRRQARESQRRRRAGEDRLRKPQAECGTLSGGKAHKRRGEPLCDACLEARREYQRSRYVPSGGRPGRPRKGAASGT